MKFDVSGKRVVITGDSSGLGEHFARVLSNAGANLGLIARREKKLNSLATELKSKSNGRIAVASCDLLDTSAIDRAMGDLRAELDGNDVLINNAGEALVSRIPQRRLGELTELDGPLLLLVSDDASYMTGTVIPVDGGHLVNSL